MNSDCAPELKSCHIKLYLEKNTLNPKINCYWEQTHARISNDTAGRK